MSHPSPATLAVFVVLALGQAQETKPLKPGTPDIVVPPPVTLPGPPKGEPAVNGPLTATDVAKIAVARQRALDLAKALVRQASGGKQAAQSALLPLVTLNSTSTSVDQLSRGSGGGSSGGPVDGSTSTLALKQLLFDFSHSADLLRQAQEIEAAAREGYRRTLASVVLTSKQLFFAVVQSDGLVSAAEANVKSRQAQLALAQARLDVGSGPPLDVVQAKTNLADAVVSLTQARQGATTARIALAQAIGLDPRAAVTPADSTEPPPLSEDLNALVEQALQHRPEMGEARATVRAAEGGLAAARTASAPVLTLNAGLGARGVSDPFDSRTASVGVTLSWSVFDGGSTAGRVEQAQGSLDVAKATLDLTSQSVVSDVALALLNLKTAEQRAAVTVVGVANALEGVRLAEGRYRAGIATFVEVTTAQASLFAAQNSDVSARASIQVARAAMAHALGLDGADRAKGDPRP